jgi:hypothetical protein
MQHRIIVTIDNKKVYRSRPVYDDFNKLNEFLEKINDMTSLRMPIRGGKFYIPQAMIRRSVFQIKRVPWYAFWLR